MSLLSRPFSPRGALLCLALAASASAPAVAPALAAGPPVVRATWVTDVTAVSAQLHAEMEANGSFTSYRFEYVSQAKYEANLNASPPRDPYAGAGQVPPGGASGIGTGSVAQPLAGLASGTVYHYRVVAENSSGTTLGPERTLQTRESAGAFKLPDGRGWEMVSPAGSGGSVQAPETLFSGGVFQAAANGGSFTYSSADAFSEPAGAPGASQYLAVRGDSGWSNTNITTPSISGSYGESPDGVPYRIFSSDLSSGLMLNGEHCRGSEGDCPVANPPLSGSGAPAGYQDYYRSEGAGGFKALLTQADFAHSNLGPAQIDVRLVAASPDLSHVVVSSCAALTASATEVAASGGCDPAAQNLYEWSVSAGLTSVNLLPGGTSTTPGAAIEGPVGAISSNGSRVYWSEGGNLFLREGGQTVQVDLAAGGGGRFETASSDGAVAYFSKAGHLYRYLASGGSSTDLLPAGGLGGVLGASESGDSVYYQTASGLFLWRNGVATEIASGSEAAAEGDYIAGEGTARVSPDGAHLAFISKAELTAYDNDGTLEAYLYGPLPGGGSRIICASCAPSGERPSAQSFISPTIANGLGGPALYRPRALSANGMRLFFTSGDALSSQDTNSRLDVYQWEASGVGGCVRLPGCVNLISSGRSPEPAVFLDASADGSDVFFLTDESLVANDSGSVDVYDARVGGGFPVPPPITPCVGDSCQGLPPNPADPTPGTLAGGSAPAATPPTKQKKLKKHHKKERKKHHRKHSKGASRGAKK